MHGLSLGLKFQSFIFFLSNGSDRRSGALALFPANGDHLAKTSNGRLHRLVFRSDVE
jgi:hypothetical protein